MMNQDLREAIPLWSLDRRGDRPCRTAVAREAVGVSSPRFIRPVPLEDPLGVVCDVPPRRVPDRATAEGITPLAMIRRILAVIRRRRGRVRARQQLKELNHHLLRDIGLGREVIDYTSPRPEMYWD